GGTGELVREVISRHQPRPMEFDVVSNPEFLREGSAIEDTLRPDRIVIGAPTQQVAMTLVELYAPLERPMIITDLPSAEVIKYASNAFLATKISFINAIANICEAAGADVTQVMKGMGLDPRIGAAFLQAGLRSGGSCPPAARLRARRTKRPRGRTPPCSSRSGTRSSTSTSSASAASCAAPSSSTGATSTSRSACAGSASSTTPSDASPSCRPEDAPLRVLVTGGAGFIGSHLCDFMLGKGCEVVCMDNLLTGSLDNIRHIQDPRFVFVEYDVTNFLSIKGDLDYVLHFASPASPIDYLELPIQTLKVGSL